MTGRLPSGGRIDRDAPLRFSVDGRELTGYRGDTVASAMLANGIIEVGPSIYRRRPRGIFTADVTEPNALLQADEPMLPATTVELFDGLAARTLSGVGRLDPTPDQAVYDKKYVHTDVLVVGAGPAGLAAALAASAGGARVMLVDDQPEPGGRLLSDGAALDWVASAFAELAGRPEVRVLPRATALRRDGTYLVVAERRADHLGPAAPEHVSRQRLWHVRARRVVLATGAHERPLVFADNDRPGVMLAGAVRTYLNRYAVLPGRRAVVLTTNDSAYDTALDLAAAGAEVAALVDTRADPPRALVSAAENAGIPVLAGSMVTGTAGERRITGVRVGESQWLDADLLAVSGGWNPAVHLYAQSPGDLRWDDGLAGFVPVPGDEAIGVAGAVAGTLDLAGCLADGARVGASAAAAVGYPGPAPELPEASTRPVAPAGPVWLAPGDSTDWRDHFVDLQRDATVADVHRATGAGMRSAEHVKRYTTIGTGHDQGRTSGVLASGVIAEALGLGSPGELGTTTFRPPYTPVSFALMAGRDRGELLDPVRVTSIQPWHVAAGAEFENVGQWKRPWYFPRPGEDMHAAVLRECRAARTGVGMQDASTLGKIDVIGRDAGQFLNRIYTNAFAKLKVGSARYGVMCTADGMVFDDGVVIRLAEDHYYLTTTTGNAAAVLDWLEEWSQTEWPELDVTFTSVTEQWATVAVVGPRSRSVVARLAPALDCANEAFPFMTVRDTTLANGIPARIARVSFSGELAFEVNVASWHGLAAWEAILAAGEEYGIIPYGTETMHVLRAEKGFPIVGQDTDGTVTPEDLGMSWIVSTRKDFVGRRSLSRPDTARTDRKHLVGLLPVDRRELLPEGAQLVAQGTPERAPVPMLGHVTSSYHSAALERTFALALVRDGRNRIGQTLLAPLGDRTIAATVTEPIFYDREGARRDG
ncbi:2Fe-2S iron-sulfur cluster-binding protein [Pseudonocardia acaciae]|uniref:2Fe-2S iron-sulfur cluster-binding protein n=1 Tax=Pseudonocardia acaciae TaxID=551276 RepID=UPI00048D1B5F|nr:2Fe-2S iron-sulfur cluster-binding protein [Pseudonocardia acaciae]